MTEQLSSAAQDRLERLSNPSGGQQDILASIKHSQFIRRLRVVLPVVATVIAAIVFSWNTLTEREIGIIQDAAEMPRQSGKNELLNPRFESTDDKNQPFTITAKRAVQDAADEDLLLLEAPTGDLLLNNGNWLVVRALQGAYGQLAGTLELSGDVQIYHDTGYQMTMPEISMNLKAQTASSQMPVAGFGPDMTLKAGGLTANAKTGHLVFNGPAKLVLQRGMNGFDKAFAAPDLSPAKGMSLR